MFVLTMKFNKKLAVIVLIALAVLLAAIVIIASGGKENDSESGGDPVQLTSTRVKSNSDRLKYLSALGWECDEQPVAEQVIVIPMEFSDIFERYNELQRAQGFDLEGFRGLEVTLYRYNVTNYPDSADTVHAQLLVHKNRVIGGDVHSTALNGFTVGLKPEG